MADQQTAWDQEEALARLSKLHQLARELREAEAKEVEAVATARQASQRRREAKAKLDAWIEADTKPLPLFDPPAVVTPPATEPEPVPTTPEPEGLVLEQDLEAMLAAESDQDADGLERQPRDYGEDLGVVEVCPGVTFRLYKQDGETFIGVTQVERFGNWDQSDLPPGVHYWPDDRIVSGVATLRAMRAIKLRDQFVCHGGRLELHFEAVAGGAMAELDRPLPEDDRTTWWERQYQLSRHRFLGVETIRDARLRTELTDWRRRQALGDVEPRWDRWSEFRVTLRDGQEAECLLRTDGAALILEAWTKALGDADFCSFSVGGPRPGSLADYAAEAVQGLVDERAGKAKPRKGKRKGARS